MNSNDGHIILKKLRNVFGHDDFKSDVQRNAVESVYRRVNDVFITMPTGAGKSLCYQLPAVLHEDKVAIVFSPLLALIKDQLDHLKEMKIPAVSINSDMSSADRSKALNDLKSKKIETRLLYVTPEQADTQQFKSLISSIHRHNKVSFIVVDEAHCVCQWGRDFRPSYLRLGSLRKQFMDIPWVALTATADVEVTEDIIRTLNLKKPVKTYRTPCFRHNLYYDVVFKETMVDPYTDLKNFILKCLGQQSESLKPNERGCGIVYCKTRVETATVADELTLRKIPAIAYNSGMSTKERTKAQNDWMGGVFPVITATIGFGMGVDKASVRFVAHWTMSQTVSAYYQESGRAGRDGKPAFCRIYHSKHDRDRLSYNINQGSSGYDGKQKEVPEEVKAQNYKKFVKLVEYCELPKCRHRVFADHFGDRPPDCGDKCDVCKDPRAVEAFIQEFVEKQDKRSVMQAVGDSSDLYGGGREGMARESQEYAGDGDREERAAKAAQTLILEKLASRRPAAVICREEQASLARSARVKAAESTVVKYNGLTIPTRENRLQAVIDSLLENYNACSSISSQTFSTSDIKACAIDAEYQVFTTHHVTSLYRMTVGKMLRDIKHSTTKTVLDDRLLQFLGGKTAARASSNPAHMEIITAREMMSRKSKEGVTFLSTDTSCDSTEPEKEGSMSSASEFSTTRKAHTKPSHTNANCMSAIETKSNEVEIISASTLLARMKTHQNGASRVKPTKPSDTVARTEDGQSSLFSRKEASNIALKEDELKYKKTITDRSYKDRNPKPKRSKLKNKPSQQATLFSFGYKTDSSSLKCESIAPHVERKEVKKVESVITDISATLDLTKMPAKLIPAALQSGCSSPNTSTQTVNSRKRKNESEYTTPSSGTADMILNKRLRSSKAQESSSKKSECKSSVQAASAKVDKQRVADLVVRHLMHYFKNGDSKMIPTSELFKLIAKKLTRPFLDGLLPPDESVVQRQVINYFKKHGAIHSAADI